MFHANWRSLATWSYLLLFRTRGCRQVPEGPVSTMYCSHTMGQIQQAYFNNCIKWTTEREVLRLGSPYCSQLNLHHLSSGVPSVTMTNEVIKEPVIKLLLSCIHSWNASFLTGGKGTRRGAREMKLIPWNKTSRTSLYTFSDPSWILSWFVRRESDLHSSLLQNCDKWLEKLK